MPSLEFFKSAGLYLKGNFLDAGQCRTLGEEMLHGQQIEAALERRGVSTLVIDPKTRRTKLAKVSKTSREEVHEALTALLPELSSHFRVQLTAVQPTNYLVYHPGDFFTRHRDVSENQDRVEGCRRVSIVVFLNDQAAAAIETSYVGGSLTFFGLQAAPFDKLGHPFSGKRGLLVAFRSEVPHEVQPVKDGIRLTAVSWCE